MKKDDAQLEFDFQEVHKKPDAESHQHPKKVKNTAQPVRTSNKNRCLPSHITGFTVRTAYGEKPPQNLFFDNQIHKLLSTREASGFLGVSENALRILVFRRRVTVYKLGNRLRFKFGDLMDCLQQKEV